MVRYPFSLVRRRDVCLGDDILEIDYLPFSWACRFTMYAYFKRNPVVIKEMCDCASEHRKTERTKEQVGLFKQIFRLGQGRQASFQYFSVSLDCGY
ncbi:hypothetical protein QQP08_005573 [Theobroma cacao]|nr:hypothetical protein QQP08_004980 [Theobroma cacao]WRX13086.1 hypothetical protein QQP08_005573 [Theobroma cacao]